LKVGQKSGRLRVPSLRPSDVVAIRLADLDTSEGVMVIRKRTQKTGAVSESILTKETAEALRAYIASAQVTDYLFRGETDKPHRHRHRTWPNGVLRKHHAKGITPRTFRRTGATNWGDDLTSLMAQGGWSDARTVLKHYRQNLRERHLKELETSVGPAADHNPDQDVPGYG
jgi:integrase